jgi:hypothetical protein
MWHHSIRKRLVLTSPTSGGRSVGIVRSRTQATEFSFLVLIPFKSKVISPAPNPQPGEPVLRIYIPQEQAGPVIPPGTGFPFRRLLRLTGLPWRYASPPLHGEHRYEYNITAVWIACGGNVPVAPAAIRRHPRRQQSQYLPPLRHHISCSTHVMRRLGNIY